MTSVALLIGQADLARSAVFEQLDSGSVVQMDGGVSADTPPGYATEEPSPRIDTKGVSQSLPAVLAGYSRKEQSDPARPMGTVVFDMSASTAPSATRASMRRSRLPSPRQLSSTFSPQQRYMRQLTARIGLSFARHPGVVRAGLDERSFVDLFTSMIHRESNFNPAAVSPAGASGLGQLMPQTAHELGVCDVFSAQDNLEGSALYLASMLDEFGSAELALAAYNAGPGAVRRYGGIPPFRETRQYVSDISHAIDRKADSHAQIVVDGADAIPDDSDGSVITAFFARSEPWSRPTPRCGMVLGTKGRTQAIYE
ncbi:lytic transglycosylase domain-containing protein [Mesorhizobium sp. GbtcB19]|uniref:lytic transglycosylase domain-containing protein n=1 Tax=Mesorhizobium sp. GbtcB19 TaxID=2824764 RepID=UPI0020C677FC|nr:lytic transglycosylase domain-containing protein [Mesorhizobium sp. GbtcB19]